LLLFYPNAFMSRYAMIRGYFQDALLLLYRINIIEYATFMQQIPANILVCRIFMYYLLKHNCLHSIKSKM
ncbi:MAG: hypothetical protein J7L96_07490, partial [Bacteroidales bacterium]|nr:hypothetical protein [Bacteroidales bacterium]